MSTIGGRIRALREERKWTQSELGRLSGISQSNINLIESGGRTNISVDTLTAIAGAFRVTTDELLAYDKDAAPIIEPRATAAEAKRLAAVERGLVDLSGMVQRGFEEIASRLPAATAAKKKTTQRKRS